MCWSSIVLEDSALGDPLMVSMCMLQGRDKQQIPYAKSGADVCDKLDEL